MSLVALFFNEDKTLRFSVEQISQVIDFFSELADKFKSDEEAKLRRGSSLSEDQIRKHPAVNVLSIYTDRLVQLAHCTLSKHITNLEALKRSEEFSEKAQGNAVRLLYSDIQKVDVEIAKAFARLRVINKEREKNSKERFTEVKIWNIFRKAIAEPYRIIKMTTLDEARQKALIQLVMGPLRAAMPDHVTDEIKDAEYSDADFARVKAALEDARHSVPAATSKRRRVLGDADAGAGVEAEGIAEEKPAKPALTIDPFAPLKAQEYRQPPVTPTEDDVPFSVTPIRTPKHDTDARPPSALKIKGKAKKRKGHVIISDKVLVADNAASKGGAAVHGVEGYNQVQWHHLKQDHHTRLLGNAVSVHARGAKKAGLLRDTPPSGAAVRATLADPAPAASIFSKSVAAKKRPAHEPTIRKPLAKSPVVVVPADSGKIETVPKGPSRPTFKLTDDNRGEILAEVQRRALTPERKAQIAKEHEQKRIDKKRAALTKSKKVTHEDVVVKAAKGAAVKTPKRADAPKNKDQQKLAAPNKKQRKFASPESTTPASSRSTPVCSRPLEAHVAREAVTPTPDEKLIKQQSKALRELAELGGPSIHGAPSAPLAPRVRSASNTSRDSAGTKSYKKIIRKYVGETKTSSRGGHDFVERINGDKVGFDRHYEQMRSLVEQASELNESIDFRSDLGKVGDDSPVHRQLLHVLNTATAGVFDRLDKLLNADRGVFNKVEKVLQACTQLEIELAGKDDESTHTIKLRDQIQYVWDHCLRALYLGEVADDHRGLFGLLSDLVAHVTDLLIKAKDYQVDYVEIGKQRIGLTQAYSTMCDLSSRLLDQATTAITSFASEEGSDDSDLFDQAVLNLHLQLGFCADAFVTFSQRHTARVFGETIADPSKLTEYQSNQCRLSAQRQQSALHLNALSKYFEMANAINGKSHSPGLLYTFGSDCWLPVIQSFENAKKHLVALNQQDTAFDVVGRANKESFNSMMKKDFKTLMNKLATQLKKANEISFSSSEVGHMSFAASYEGKSMLGSSYRAPKTQLISLVCRVLKFAFENKRTLAGYQLTTGRIAKTHPTSKAIVALLTQLNVAVQFLNSVTDAKNLNPLEKAEYDEARAHYQSIAARLGEDKASSCSLLDWRACGFNLDLLQPLRERADLITEVEPVAAVADPVPVVAVAFAGAGRAPVASSLLVSTVPDRR